MLLTAVQTDRHVGFDVSPVFCCRVGLLRMVVCVCFPLFSSVPDGLYTYEGSDAPDVSNGRPSNNMFTANTISDCDIGVKINEGDDNSFIGEKETTQQ